ncbi:MAG: hypothetical protein LQ349_007182 [Xanthoria aureola]|nr:MAG: hypothetical protein LQ349_007182 [Xanthoria aureola]
MVHAVPRAWTLAYESSEGRNGSQHGLRKDENLYETFNGYFTRQDQIKRDWCGWLRNTGHAHGKRHFVSAEAASPPHELQRNGLAETWPTIIDIDFSTE